MLAKAKVEMKPDDLASKAGDKGLEAQKPEDIQRAAVKKLRALNDKLPMEAWARPLAAGIEAPIGEETAAAFRTAWAVADAGA